jgi:hypothetical protein
MQRRHVKTVCALHYGLHLSRLVINGIRYVCKFLVLILQFIVSAFPYEKLTSFRPTELSEMLSLI